jgi:hypothetical protein
LNFCAFAAAVRAVAKRADSKSLVRVLVISSKSMAATCDRGAEILSVETAGTAEKP